MRTGTTSNIGRWALLCILLAVAGLPAFPVSAANDVKEEELRADIVYRCYNVVGEFGSEGVEACVKGELSAMQALKGYPREAGEIVQRCTRQVQITGWEWAKSCVDKDIAARNMKKD
jgi:hypothetical protein